MDLKKMSPKDRLAVLRAKASSQEKAAAKLAGLVAKSPDLDTLELLVTKAGASGVISYDRASALCRLIRGRRRKEARR